MVIQYALHPLAATGLQSFRGHLAAPREQDCKALHHPDPPGTFDQQRFGIRQGRKLFGVYAAADELRGGKP